MAGSTGDVGVAIGECEPSRAVIESSSSPGNGVMAVGAICSGESGTGIRVGGAVRFLPGGEMATRITAVVGLNGQIVIVVDVA